jgi:hypothetical protein
LKNRKQSDKKGRAEGTLLSWAQPVASHITIGITLVETSWIRKLGNFLFTWKKESRRQEKTGPVFSFTF